MEEFVQKTAGTIVNCSVNITADVNSQTSNLNPVIAGIAGWNYGIIYGCNVSGTIEGKGQFIDVAGISGVNSGEISYCTNEATITASGNQSNCGGIVAKNSDGEVSNCINKGILNIGCYDGGGIAGKQDYSGGTISECANLERINCIYSNTAHGLGGICGCNYNDLATIQNCYNTGNFYNDDSRSSLFEIGGILGGANESIMSASSIENCYSIANIIVSSGNNTAFKPVSSITQVNATNCYYNSDICSKSDDTATGLTTSQMKASNFVSQLGSAYVSDSENSNNGYPIFWWQAPEN